MKGKNLYIEDFSENDFNDPISLLKALKCQSEEAQLIQENASNPDRLLISDIERDYGISLDRIMVAIQTGELNPVSVIPVFMKEDVINFCNSTLSYNPLYGAFEKELLSMNMSYSYKPILLLALLNNNSENKNVKLDYIIDFFLEYYNDRVKKSLVVEKQNSVFIKKPNNRQTARATILRYPIKVLSNKSFISYDKTTDSVMFNGLLFSEFDKQYLLRIEKQCKLRLEQYYSSI